MNLSWIKKKSSIANILDKRQPEKINFLYFDLLEIKFL